MQASQISLPSIEYAVRLMSLPGEKESGDQYIVVQTDQGTLVGVVDGLGHGEEAAKAARVAVEILQRNAQQAISELIRECHEAMKATRGAVMTLAWCSRMEHNLTLLSVGNVEGVLLRADAQANPPRENVVMRGGVVGSHLPALRAAVTPVWPGDVLIIATDGIRSGFDRDVPLSASPQHIADSICLQYGKGTDDALVLVVRFLGGGS